MYQATEYRDKPVEESMELITRDLGENNARALKIKIGGMIRAMKVALMASALGKSCTPHMSGGDLGFLYMMHFVSALPNAMPHHEFKGFNTNVIFECLTSPLQSVNGAVKVPTGPGSGVDIDPDFIGKFQLI